ncbi:MAG: NUDIX hydrolase [Paracoccus sp. (in: a-proteobacteria)]|nr:NUDIX hydrolase [Paracoccus sp. (in: a-proteobacteria)]
MTSGFRERLGRLLGRKPHSMQVAALCFDQRGRVLLITSRGTGRWIIPKGWPMAGRSLAQAAMQEAWEEAGVRGRLDETPIGSYHYDKRHDRGFSVPTEVQVFAVAVHDLAEEFPERDQRRRGWFSALEAADLVDEPGLQEILRDLRPRGVRARPA